MEKRDPFNLSSLPELEPPQDGWHAIASQLDKGKRQKRVGIFAIAATIVLAVTIGLILPELSTEPGKKPTSTSTDLALMAEPNTVDVSKDDPLQSLKSLSGQLEDNLRRLRAGVGGMPAEVVAYQVELEDLVAQVDEALMWQPDSTQLWQQRVNLLLDLSQVYGAGLRRDYQSLASL